MFWYIISDSSTPSEKCRMVGLDIEGRVKEYDEYLTTHCRFVLVGRIEKIWGSTIIDQSTSLSSK